MGKVPVYVRGDGADVWVEWMGKCKAESGWELVLREGTLMGELVVSGRMLSDTFPDPSIQLANGDDSPYLSNGTLMFPVPDLRHLGHPPSNPTPEECTFIRSLTAQRTLDQLFPLHPTELPSHALKYIPDVRLSFVLLNEDSTTGGFTNWEISRAINSTSLLYPCKPLLIAPQHTLTP